MILESLGKGVASSALAIRGHLKIGRFAGVYRTKGGNLARYPEKMGQFWVTTTERETEFMDRGKRHTFGDGRDQLYPIYRNFLPDAAVMAKISPDGQPITRIRVAFPRDDLEAVYTEMFAFWTRRGDRICASDPATSGTTAIWTGGQQVPLPAGIGQTGEIVPPARRGEPEGLGVHCQGIHCPEYRARRCNLRLKMIVSIEADPTMGSAYVFKSKGLNTCQFLRGSILDLDEASRGRLGAIAMDLVVGPKRVTVPETGKSEIVYAVWLDFEGDRLGLLEEAAARETRMLTAIKILGARRLLPSGLPAVEGDDNSFDDVIDVEAEVVSDESTASDASATTTSAPQKAPAEPEPRQNGTPAVPETNARTAPAAAPDQPETAPKPVQNGAGQPTTTTATTTATTADNNGDVEGPIQYVWLAAGGLDHAEAPAKVANVLTSCGHDVSRLSLPPVVGDVHAILVTLDRKDLRAIYQTLVASKEDQEVA